MGWTQKVSHGSTHFLSDISIVELDEQIKERTVRQGVGGYD
jgi:hypothetical protein